MSTTTRPVRPLVAPAAGGGLLELAGCAPATASGGGEPLADHVVVGHHQHPTRIQEHHIDVEIGHGSDGRRRR